MSKRPSTIKGWLEDIATELHRTNELLEEQARRDLALAGAKIERDDFASAGPFVGKKASWRS